MKKFLFVFTLMLALCVPWAQGQTNTNPLCFTANTAGSTIELIKINAPTAVTIQYQVNGTAEGGWTSVDFSTVSTTRQITLANAGDKVYFRNASSEVTGFSIAADNYYRFLMSGSIAASGNVMSLVDKSCQTTTIPCNSCFENLFQNCSTLTVAPALPATTLANTCYSNMFQDCSSLTTAPELPATTLADSCYRYMFRNCSALTAAPALPAETLATACYNYMFDNCSTLTVAPALPATNLATNCYGNMFSHCTSLTAAPALPAETLAAQCYSDMFLSCTSLTVAPALPATNLANNCYQHMFGSCTSLTTAPALPATTLDTNCYTTMFQMCTALTTAPALPADSLAYQCYMGMFLACSALTTPPALPATTLANNCYQSMFQACSTLTTPPALPATTLANNCYQSMFQACSTLTTLPTLPATTLANNCYNAMFKACTSLEVNTAAPGVAWSLPAGATVGNGSLTNMFQNTGDNFIGTPEPGTTYYIASALTGFTITANVNDTAMGNVTGAGNYTAGTTATLTATAKEGYRFSNWTNANGGIVSTANPWTLTVASDTTVTANFAIDRHDVATSVNNATMGSVTAGGTYDYGAQVTLTATPAAEYRFTNWSNANTGAILGTANPWTFTVEQDTNVVANFERDEYTISLYTNDYTMGTVSGGGTYLNGTSVTITATANEHYHFDQWNNGSTSPSYTFTVTSNQTIVAQFLADQYTVLALANDDTMGSVEGSGVYDYNTEVVLTATANEHYHFVGWSNGETATSIIVQPSSDTTITATFAPDMFTLTVLANDAAMGSVSGAGDYAYGTVATLTASATAGHHFVAWSNGDTAKTIEVIVESDLTFTAIFAANIYYVTAVANDDQMGSVTGSGNYGYGETATLVASANEGYHFVEWSNGDTAETIAVLVESDTTLTATFAIDQFTVTAAANSDVMGSVTGSGNYDYGETATLTASATAGHHFVAWSNGDTAETIAVLVERDTTLTAIFAANTYHITAVADDDLMGSVTGSGDYDYGETATLSASATAGYHFVKWTDDNTDNPRNFTVTCDSSFTAQFAANSYNVAVVSDNDVMGSVAGAGSYTYNTDAQISATANYGYHFTQWSDGNTDNPRMLTVVCDSSFTAQFAANSYSVTVVSANTTMGAVAGSDSYTYNSNAQISATANYGYHFTAWNDGNTDNPRTVVVTENATYTAQFAANNYNVAVVSANNVMGSVAGAGSYTYNTDAQISATANYGYHFTQWSDGNTDNPRTLTVVCDSSFTAQFAANSYSVTVVSANTTMGAVAGSDSYTYNSNAQISATANYGYHFTAWNDGNTDNPRTVVVTENATYTAQFAANSYNVAVVSDNNVMGSVAGAGSYVYNTDAQISATANYGYHFTQWSDGNTDNPRTVVVTRDSAFTAQFAANSYNVAVVSANNVMGSVAGAGSYVYNTDAQISATANYGYHFTQWSDGNTDNPRMLTVVCDSVFTAQFATNTYRLTLLTDEVMGSVMGAGDFEYDASTIISASANYGYHFTGWSDGVTTNPRMITVTKDSTITALFANNTYHVATSVNIDEAGAVTGAADYLYLEPATLLATATPCYHFVSWNDGVTDNPRFVEVESDTAFTAIFELNVYESEFSVVACDSYAWDDDVYTESGDYQHVYPTVNGCDSTVTLHLVVNYSDEGEFSDQASELYVWDGREYTESGDYTFVYQNVYGCDSTMTLHLTIANFPTPLIKQVNNRALMVSHYPDGGEYVDYADYRWYRNGELVASGADNYLEASGTLNGCYTLDVPVNAEKTVWVHSNELCFQNGVLVGIEDADAIEISFSVAPNPVAKGATMTISTELPEHMLQGATLTMFDLNGRIITSMPMTQQSVSLTADQASGVYMIQIMTRSGEKHVKKVIVR